MDTPFVHAAPGDSAQLECIVQGNPEPTVRKEPRYRDVANPLFLDP